MISRLQVEEADINSVLVNLKPLFQSCTQHLGKLTQRLKQALISAQSTKPRWICPKN